MSVVLPLIAVAAGVVACSQIIGADKKRRVADEPDTGGTNNNSGQPDALTPDQDAESDAGDQGLPPCPEGQKRCSGACVAIDDPTFGCTATSCERCSLPHTDAVKCAGGACAVATCAVEGSGRADCNVKGSDGCEGDLGSYKTCGSCTQACGGQKPFCNAGSCVDQCPAPKILCTDGTDAGADAGGGDCVDTTTNPSHCGVCNKKCPDANNGTGICLGGECTIKCNTGFKDCDEPPNLTNGCEPLQPYYVDGDGDGFGVLPQIGQDCKAPTGHSLAAGDCHDGNPAVKPGQTTFFAQGYTKAGGGNTISYDYNCNLLEDSEPGKPIGDCGSCLAGYTPAPPRTGAANIYCGATNFVSCASVCMSASASTYRCR